MAGNQKFISLRKITGEVTVSHGQPWRVRSGTQSNYISKQAAHNSEFKNLLM